MTLFAISAEASLFARIMVALDRTPGANGHGLDGIDRGRIGRFAVAQGTGIDDSRLGCWFSARSVRIAPTGCTLWSAVIAEHGLSPREIPTPEQVAVALEPGSRVRSVMHR